MNWHNFFKKKINLINTQRSIYQPTLSNTYLRKHVLKKIKFYRFQNIVSNLRTHKYMHIKRNLVFKSKFGTAFLISQSNFNAKRYNPLLKHPTTQQISKCKHRYPINNHKTPPYPHSTNQKANKEPTHSLTNKL